MGLYTFMRESSFDCPSDNIFDWLAEHYPDEKPNDDFY
ncbi:hypothetical protein PI125_g21530 [Phytophthora idaei]|nr:hypothetical protein PI125_g21530 [Phytophthora idaei]